MRTYEEIYDLFVDLINNKIDEVKLSFAEIKMLSRVRPKYNYVLNNIYQEGFYNNYADVLIELCKKNNIIQYEDILNNCYVYKRIVKKLS